LDAIYLVLSGLAIAVVKWQTRGGGRQWFKGGEGTYAAEKVDNRTFDSSPKESIPLLLDVPPLADRTEQKCIYSPRFDELLIAKN
jgi:hypothetical protein